MTEEALRQALHSLSATVSDALRQITDPEQARPIIVEYVQRWARQQLLDGSLVSEVDQRNLVQAICDERYELGALTPYVRDANVESIDGNGCDQVWITYRDGRTELGPRVADTDADLIKLIQRWVLHKSYNTREFSAANPLVNAALRPCGGGLVGVRLSADMSVTERPGFSFRCHRLVDVTLDDLEKIGTVSASLNAFLQAAVRARKNIVITGGTAAGKTTMLRALSAAIDPYERIITLESDYELSLDKLPHRHVNVWAYQARQANSEGAGAITLHELIPHALRRNPKRIIVGEVRADEIIPMFEAMNTGHPGSMCTIHADGTHEVFNRIVMLWTRGAGSQTPASVIHLNTGETIDFVVHLRVDPDTYQRYVSDVLEVLPPADSDLPARNRIYRPKGPGGRAEPHIPPQCIDDLKRAGFDPGFLQPDTGGLR